MRRVFFAVLCCAAAAGCRTTNGDGANLRDVTVTGTQGVAFSSDGKTVTRATCMNLSDAPRGTPWAKVCNTSVTHMPAAEFRGNLQGLYESAFGASPHASSTLDQLMSTLAAPASTESAAAATVMDKQTFAESQLLARLMDQAIGAAGGGSGDGSTALLRFDAPASLVGRGYSTMDFALKAETALQGLRITLVGNAPGARSGTPCPFAPLNIQAIDNGRLNETAKPDGDAWQFAGVVKATGLRFTWLGGSGACQLSVVPTPRVTAQR